MQGEPRVKVQSNGSHAIFMSTAETGAIESDKITMKPKFIIFYLIYSNVDASGVGKRLLRCT